MLRQTRSVCPTCLADVDAQVVVGPSEVVLRKTCPAHGVSEQLLSRAPRYWADLDRYYFMVNGTEWPQRDFIVRMTERCNLDCPICLAKANTEDTPDLDLGALDALLTTRQGLKIDLMAAEPTLREDLEAWIRRCKENGHIASLHTNGLKLAKPEYAQRLARAGLDEVFLQFDGLDEEANKALRGRPLLKARMRALDNLRDLGVSTSLIAVIGRQLNEAEVSHTLRFALAPGNENIKEVFFMGLRLLGHARAAVDAGDPRFSDAAMMPDEIIDLLSAQEPRIPRDDIRRFNKLYFAMLSVFGVKKCLYVQHYLLVRDGEGGFQPISELIDLEKAERAAEQYADSLARHPRLARVRFLATLATCARRDAAGALFDLVRLQDLFRSGMNLRHVPRRFLMVGFITACDPWNFDAQVAVNCGKGELSADGGFVDSGAVANVRREARFAASSV